MKKKDKFILMIDFDFQNENKYYIILITISKDYN